jgi:hypothetical protein
MGLASIDAFLDLAEREPDPGPDFRTSLRRLRRGLVVAPADPERRERGAMLAFVVIAHLLFALLLRGAMRPWFPAQSREEPITVTFVSLRPPVAKPQPVVVPEPIARVPSPAHTPSLPHATNVPRTSTNAPSSALARPAALAPSAVPRADELRATVVPAVPRVDAPPSPAVLYDRTGTLQVPSVATPAAPRDLLAHRNYSYMLPGAPRADSPDFHVTPGRSPQDVVNTAGRILSSLIAGVPPRPDGNGAYVQAADRGLRMSGRDSDPCEDIALDMADVNPDDGKVREQAAARWERSCEGK